MSSAPSPKQIAADAAWLVQALDPSQGQARLIAMDRDSYRAASFLDDRMLQQAKVDAQIVAWPVLEEVTASAGRTDARWIFHIGHVGSTLVSRLLGELDDVLAIREPRILRDLVLSPAPVRERYIASIPQLMSRTFAEDEIACVKATSFASEIAACLVPSGERALFMYASAPNYIGSILAGPNSVQEMHMLAPSRAERLSSRGLGFSPANDAEIAAAAWACEMTALEAAAEAMSDRHIEWADFDMMLGDMAGALSRTAIFFGFSPDGSDAIASGPLMGRYSKATEYEYSPNLRRDLIAEATHKHRADIDGALAMLRRAAESSPLLAQAMRRSEGN